MVRRVRFSRGRSTILVRPRARDRAVPVGPSMGLFMTSSLRCIVEWRAVKFTSVKNTRLRWNDLRRLDRNTNSAM